MYNQLTVVLLLGCLVIVCCDLKFNADGKFKIVQLTDMHMGELESNDINTRKIQKIVLETEKPDLIVVSGDAVSGYAYPNNNTCM
jgi:predicted MPP superfamily phosphohydrolase